MNEANMGGYPFDVFLDLPSSTHLCVKCKLVLRDPYQTACGHSFCRQCKDTIKTDTLCPACAMEDDGDEGYMKDLRRDPAKAKEINKLKVRCTLCDWQGVLKDLDSHICQGYAASPKDPLDEEKDKTKDESIREDIIGFLPDRFRDVTTKLENMKNKQAALVGVEVRNMDVYMKKIDRCDNLISQTEAQLKTIMEVGVIAPFPLSDLAQGTTAAHAYDDHILRNFSADPDEIIRLLEKLIADIRTFTECIRIQRQREENETAAELENLQNRTVTLQSAGVQQQTKMIAVERRIEELELGSDDGRLVWPITDMKSKLRKRDVILSPRFTMRPQGRKFGLSLNLAGLQDNRTGHAALSLISHMNDWDGAYDWPAEVTSTICLMFPGNEVQNMKYEDRATVTKPPGLPKIVLENTTFANLKQIQDRSDSDTIFIKVNLI